MLFLLLLYASFLPGWPHSLSMNSETYERNQSASERYHVQHWKSTWRDVTKYHKATKQSVGATLCKVLRVVVQLCNRVLNLTSFFGFLLRGAPDLKGASVGSVARLGFALHTLTPLSVSRSQSERQLHCINCRGKNKPRTFQNLIPCKCFRFFSTTLQHTHSSLHEKNLHRSQMVWSVHSNT